MNHTHVRHRTDHNLTPLGRVLALTVEAVRAERLVAIVLLLQARGGMSAPRARGPARGVDPDDPARRGGAQRGRLSTISRALWSDRKVAVRYVRADNTMVQRRLDALGLVLKAGQWYLVALTGRYDATFRVSRVRHAEVLDEPTSRPADFELPAYWATFLADFEERRSPLAVRIRVAPDAVDLLPRVLGEPVRARLDAADPDADGWVAIDLRYESLDDARAELLGLGAAVRVVHPPELCDELVRIAGDVVRAYGGA